MQNPSRHSYGIYAPLQPIEPLPNWSWNSRVVASNKGAMEIGGLLSGNVRHSSNADAHLRHAEAHLRHNMQPALTMDTHFSDMGHAGGMGHHPQQYNMNPSMHYPHMGQPVQHPGMMHSNISPTSAHSSGDMDANSPKVKNEQAAKTFACSTCNKAFARRSDLARHERIHSGDRPHKCDYPGCAMAFIQRSALTVHSRTHTGEKPHKCEKCKKPFSDSSSLARHRRIHSGKRPYKCPFASCQRAFTRKTTMTRHQAQHTGQVDQVDGGHKLSIPSTSHSGDDGYSDSRSSRNSTASLQDQPSISPNDEAHQLGLQRQSQDYNYMAHNNSLPPHMRSEYTLGMRHAQTVDAAPANYTSAPQPRTSITSNPTSYGPPQPLEPPANGTASDGASPHISAMGWGSPTHGNLPSPTAMDFANYPDPTYGGQQLYFPGNGMRRPQSTEPEDWSLRSNRNQNNYHHHLNMGHDWNAMQMPEIKQERTYAM